MKITENQIINRRYRLINELGRGGFAEVWLAEDIELDNRQVALKFFASERGLDSGGIELFKKEFIRTTELRHPNLLISNHYGVVENERIPFLEMPYCSGGSLSSKVQSGSEFTEREIASILKDVGNGLSYLHEQGVIHRDLKPDNILISDTGKYLISDFGISLRLRSTLTKATQRKAGSSSGTTAFMAPELFRNEPNGSEKSDIFGLGVTIYELCTGILPWQEIGGLALFQGAESPSLPPQYSKRFEKLFHRCLEVDPQRRPTAKELEQAAESFLREGAWPNWEAEPNSKVEEAKKGESAVRRTEAFIKVEDRNPGPSKEATQKETPIKKSKTTPWVGIIGGIVLISVIVIFIGVFLFSMSPPYSNQTEPVDSSAWHPDSTSQEQLSTNTTASVSPSSQQEPSGGTLTEQNSNLEQQRIAQEAIRKQKEEEDKRLLLDRAEKEKLEIAINDGIAAFRAKDYDKAFQLLKYAVEQGSEQPYFYLAYMYKNGLGTSTYYGEALRLYTLCANSGDKVCQSNLGLMYEFGEGVAKNNYEATKWYRKAAEQGFAPAQCYLGESYENGLGIEKDYNEAEKWYRNAADQGNATAQSNLGNLYYNGKGVTKNFYEAIKWYRKAAEQNHAYSQYSLGHMYEHGQGVTKDFYEAGKWYRMAADQGEENSIKALARLNSNAFSTGERVITGRVTASQDGGAMPGTNVVLKGTTNGTVTDADGNYQLSVPATGGILVFSFIGFTTVEAVIDADNRVDVAMSTRRRR